MSHSCVITHFAHHHTHTHTHTHSYFYSQNKVIEAATCFILGRGRLQVTLFKSKNAKEILTFDLIILAI